MKNQLMRLGSIAVLASLVACQGIEAPEGEDPLDGEEAESSEEASSDEGFGEAEQALCVWSTISPPPYDDHAFMGSDPGVYLQGTADGGCDPYVASVTALAHTIKRAEITTGILGNCSQITKYARRFWYDDPSTGWHSVAGTITLEDTYRGGPSGTKIPVCEIVASSGNFPSNNDYTRVRSVLWLENFEPEVGVTTYKW